MVHYGPPPEWVEVYDAADIGKDKTSSIALLDMQQRIEDGLLTVYLDNAVRLSSPEALTMAGTSAAIWFPDKGDLTVHRVEILRGDETIDVLAGGNRYSVLRRELGLEQRMLDGSLTATLAIPGLRVGDIIRISYSQTSRDAALQGQVENASLLLAAPIEAEFGRVRASWPVDEKVAWRAGPAVDGVVETTARGMHTIALALPLAKREDMPGDAPSRYTRPPILQLGTFEDWPQVSRIFAPLYRDEAMFAEGKALLAAEIRKIEAASADPLARATLATKLVQDQVSYLAVGMNGGNYVPQAPTRTWEMRYGDCKAKTVLLLMLLDALGIESEPLLVNTRFGDGIPDMLPMAGVFDHVIVHATIAGRSYWLDGTSTGVTPGNIADTPAFHYGLPLRPEGAGLLAIEPRLPTEPAQEIEIVFDESGGVDLPAIATFRLRHRGALASMLTALDKGASDEQRKSLVESAIGQIYRNVALFETAIIRDEDAQTVTIEGKGLISPPWSTEDGRRVQKLDVLPSTHLDFDHDRARPAWREIPVDLGAPELQVVRFDVILPEGEDGYVLRGRTEIDESFPGMRIARKVTLADGRLGAEERVEVLGGEIAPADIPAGKAAAAKISASAPSLLAPQNAARRWEYARPALRRRVAPYEKAYAAAIARDPEPARNWINRASFRKGILDLEGALADMNEAIKRDPSAENYGSRSNVQKLLGNHEAALADHRKAFELAPSANHAISLATALGMAGKPDEAMALIDEYDDYGTNHEYFEMARAEVLAFNGKGIEGLALVDALVSERPDQAHRLNGSCWYRARFGVGGDDMMRICNEAVEKARNPGQVLDSRALAFLQSGDFARARDDANAALLIYPLQYQTRFVRAFALRALADPKGTEELRYLSRHLPGLADEYARYGLKP
ncbi:hypothetical protein B2G71_05025 [Novosphingobium sp. PC22D]|nr:hypothetical protein B2G71_05025 [Novosphingobium sp. PC22D]